MSDASLPTEYFDAPEWLANQLNVQGVIVLVRFHDGRIGFAGHGFNHAKANEMLSVGIHLNLSDHDRQIAAGVAGPEIQKKHAGLSQD